jgi:hypothetical protein
MLLPALVVLDVREGLRGMLARHRIGTRWIPFHGQEVEPALIAKDVQLLGQVWAFTTSSLDHLRR